MKKIVLMLAAVLALSSVSAFASKHEAKKGHEMCKDGKDAHGQPCKDEHHK